MYSILTPHFFFLVLITRWESLMAWHGLMIIRLCIISTLLQRESMLLIMTIIVEWFQGKGFNCLFRLIFFSFLHLRVIFEVTEEGCVPDGMTIDSEDFLWIAIWGGQRVIRYGLWFPFFSYSPHFPELIPLLAKKLHGFEFLPKT